jgi:hypothetical protein
MLDGTSAKWTQGRTREGSWRAVDIIGHLLQGELVDWIPRTRVILEHGESKPFEPFDREGYERVTAGKGLSRLLDDFTGAREASLRELDSIGLDDSMLDKTGTHPDLGRITLRQMLATWTAHDLSHIGQIADSMARRYRDEVGPWRRYLPVLDRPEEDSG